jgi:hypothetical protein
MSGRKLSRLAGLLLVLAMVFGGAAVANASTEPASGGVGATSGESATVHYLKALAEIVWT